MAVNVQKSSGGLPSPSLGLPLQSMNRDFQNRFTVVLLTLLTGAAVVFAWINFQKRDFQVPTDGARWLEQGGSLAASRVEFDGPAAKAGIKKGDQLVAVNQHPLNDGAGLSRQLFLAGPWSKATYSLVRNSVSLDTVVVLIPDERPLNTWLRLISLIYFGIGLYVLLRRWTAPGSMHFYIFCLVSFVFYSFHPTGKLNSFDWIIYGGNVAAGLFQPALFLHFVLTFPERRGFVRRHRWILYAVYLPAVILFSIHGIALRFLKASARLAWDMDRLQMGHLALYFVAASAVLWYSYQRARTPILRQQLKWLTRGTILAIAPFTLLYVIPTLTGALPTMAMKISVLSLGLLPLTFGYAIFRYRLMDVDLIFKRGMAYTLAAAAIVGAYFGVVAAIAELVHTRVPSSGPYGLVVAVIVTALLFDPVRKRIQEKLDRFFSHAR